MRNVERVLQVVILLAFIFYAQFYKLDAKVYQLYDEAHRAINAYEMVQTGNLIVTTAGYQPDMSGTKPPFMIWVEALCIKLNGMNEISARLPSALAATCTALIIFAFVLYITKSGWAALLSGIVLCTATGYLEDHGTRYGEYDGVLTLFTTLTVLALFFYAEEEDKKKKGHYLLGFFVALTLGLLTKGIAIMMFGPALFIFLLWRKQLISTLKHPGFYAGLGIFIVFGLGYYVLRDTMNPGYIKAVFNNELGGRYAAVNDGHSGPFSYYFNNLKVVKFDTWFWALPVALILLPFNDNEKRQRVSMYMFICTTGFLLVLSSAATKLYWYDLPMYPLLAVIIAIMILQLADYVSWAIKFLSPKAALLLLMLIFSIQPVYRLPAALAKPQWEETKGFYDISYFLRDKARNGKQELKNAIYIHDGYFSMGSRLYVHEMNDAGMNIKQVWRYDKKDFKAGDKIVSNDTATNIYIETAFDYKTLDQLGNTRLYLLLSGEKAGM